MSPIGVGIIGAGPVTQAIHIPTLTRLCSELSVVHVMDVDAEIAESVAARVGSRWSLSVEELLADPAVEVVAICSPHQFHADQVIAAIDAGMRGILCEKPFAVSPEEAAKLATVAAKAGVPLLVGAMHTFDPAWAMARSQWGDLAATAHTVRSSIVLPSNTRFEDWATEILARPAASEPPDLSDSAVRASRYRDGILGLAIHNLPLVRVFVPTIDVVSNAEALAPYGYAATVKGGGRRVELLGYMHGQWRPSWTLEVWAPAARLKVEFPPSYVHSGSATAELTTNGVTRRIGPFAHNGYDEEWRRLARLVGGERQSPEELESYIADLTYAFRIAEAVPLPAAPDRGTALA